MSTVTWLAGAASRRTPAVSVVPSRHLSMIALDGAIGAGLFAGSGAGTAAAGPSVVIFRSAAAPTASHHLPSRLSCC
ncbi:hypothetical protein [Streptomyces sp. JW3]|uniref:hypothetical protein n=1 Tax=Streptomyces sp. JW3 TaxID=3456955 RepID=UPI003FA43D2A